MNDDIQYDISGNDDFEYAQGLCSQSEDYYGLDLSSDAIALAQEAEYYDSLSGMSEEEYNAHMGYDS